MDETLAELRATIAAASAQLRAIPESESGLRPSPGKWSGKELLGHLLDSASNNHQRFVRAQLDDGLALPGYAQEAWVQTQSYQSEPWNQLVDFWTAYNLHLLHVMANARASALANSCSVAGGEPVSLEFLMRDYVSHLKHHLAQLLPDKG
jgi:hypothetical protein